MNRLPAREFVHAVLDYCRSHEMLPENASVIAGVSGGPDSLALLHVLNDLAGPLKLTVRVAHLNHNLRKGAAADADFVRREAARLGRPCTIGRRNVKALAARMRLSIEEAGRLARFSFFFRLARSLKAPLVAVGHTRDDQVETVLMRLLRGASASGLSGISPMRRLKDPLGPAQGRGQVRLIRPLLARSRGEIEDFLAARGARPRSDPSNRNLNFTRNRIRRELLPMLERKYNPGIRNLLVRTAQALAEDDELLETMAGKAAMRAGGRFPGGFRLRLDILRREPLPVRRRVLRLAALAGGADPRRLKQSHLDALVRLSAARRGECDLPGARARAGSGTLVVAGRIR